MFLLSAQIKMKAIWRLYFKVTQLISPTIVLQIMDTSYVFDNINLGRRIDVQWPNEEWRQSGGKSGWNGWSPSRGMEGMVVHKWVPCHRDTLKRSHINKVIYLLQISDKYVPISEQGVLDLAVEPVKT